MSFIEMRNIRKDFGKSTILHGVNMNLEKGEVISIIGPSGAGKSTLLRCLNHLELIQGGSICVGGEYLAQERDGRVVYADDVTARRILLRMGMVFQSFNLFPHMTVLDNILAAPVYVKGMKREDVIPAADALLDKVGLLNKKDVYPGSLSGGQKQRVSIARIFLKNPPILILDEATSALDSATEARITQAFDRLSKGRTTLVIAHRLSTIRNADEIAVVDEHGIAEMGTHDELLAAGGEYKKLHEAQNRFYVSV